MTDWRAIPTRDTLQYDSSNTEYTALPTSYSTSTLQNVSVALYIDASTDDAVLLGYDDTEYYSLSIGQYSGIASGNFGVKYYDADNNTTRVISSGVNVNDGDSHHVAFTFDSGTARLYVDGVEEAKETHGSNIGTGSTRYGFLGVGSQATSEDGSKEAGSYYDGEQDEVYQFNRTLSASEVEDLEYGRGNEIDTSNLTLYYDHSEGTGTTLGDGSGNSNDGTVNGASWDGGFTEPEGELYDLTLTDSVNRFARKASLKIDDESGDKKDVYPRGVRVEIYYSRDSGDTWTRRFAGFCPEPAEETTSSGASIIEAEVVGYDNLFRRREVYKTYTSTSVSTILNDLITTFTAINYNASKVEVVDDVSITREFRGERVEEALAELSSISATEEYGVDNDFEFFFQPEDTARAPEDILEGDWLDYDLPEKGKRSINNVRVFYGESGSKSSVIVEDRGDQLQLKDTLDAPRNPVIQKTATYPEISNETAAKNKAEQILEDNSQVQTGDVTSFNREEVTAGEVFRLQIPEKNIDDDFRVAEIEYSWKKATSTFTVAENVGEIQELLVDIADDVNRVSARDADPDAAFTRFLNLPLSAEVTNSLSVKARSPDDDAFIPGFSYDVAGFSRDTPGFRENRTTVTENSGKLTVEALNSLRDVWQGETAATQDAIAIGDGSSPASQTDGSLDNELKRGSVTTAKVNNQGIEFTASFSADTLSTLSEYGLFVGNGDLHYRGVSDSLDVSGVNTVSVEFTWRWQDDSDVRGVLTTTGQQRWRDLYLGASSQPSDMVIGTGTTSPDVSDSSLGNQVGEAAVSTSDKQVGVTTMVARWAADEINGNDLSEIGEENSSDELLSRQTFEPLSKTSDFALEVNHRTKIDNA